MNGHFLVSGWGESLKYTIAQNEHTARAFMSVMLDSGAFYRVTIEHVQGEEGCLISDYSIPRVLH